MSSFKLNNVYIRGKYTVASKMEKEGPINRYIDYLFDNNYCSENNFERAEQNLNKIAIDAILKNYITLNEIDLFIGGDLLNQLSSSNYIMRNYDVPFIGTYAACATSGLNIILASTYIEGGFYNNILVFTSSHYNTAERQFRYPIEYGVQKKDSSTFTVTGSGAVLLSKKINKIKISSYTIGKVLDYGINNVNDFGSCMAIAAFDTFKRHFSDLKISYDYYDLILTGDLSNIGKKIFNELLKHENINVKKYDDCGTIIYDINNQKVFSGGSGCACSMAERISSIVP